MLSAVLERNLHLQHVESSEEEGRRTKQYNRSFFFFWSHYFLVSASNEDRVIFFCILSSLTEPTGPLIQTDTRHQNGLTCVGLVPRLRSLEANERTPPTPPPPLKPPLSRRMRALLHLTRQSISASCQPIRRSRRRSRHCTCAGDQIGTFRNLHTAVSVFTKCAVESVCARACVCQLAVW